MNSCTVIVSDEVNCKLEGLDVALRRRLHKDFKKDIPGARYSPAVRLGRWDGKKAFFSLAGNTFVHLLSDLLPLVESAGYNIQLQDQRTYNTDFEFEEVTADSYSQYVWPQGHPNEGQPIQLRPHQVEVVNRFLQQRQGIGCIATGSGKTLIAAALSHRCEPHGRTIVIVPNKSLVVQTERDYRLLNLDVGVWFGDRRESGRKHTICTWQSLNIMMKNSRQGEAEIHIEDFFQGVVAVIVDEAHSCRASALSELLVGPLSHVPIRWGLTGTIPKDDHDWTCLRVGIGPVTQHLAAAELQDLGILSNCHVNIRQLVDHGEYRDYQSELKYLVGNAERMGHIAGMIEQIARTGNTLVLVDRLNAGEYLCASLSDAVFVSGKDKIKTRKAEYDQMELDKSKILVATYGIAAVGVNIVNVHNVVLIEPGKSFVRTIQSIGRGLRKGNQKDFVNIWDVTSTLKFSKRHLAIRKKFYDEVRYPYSVTKVDWRAS
jgi:superfamily II DNA or RNA helicase